MNKTIDNELEEFFSEKPESNLLSRFSGVTTDLGKIRNLLNRQEIQGDLFSHSDNEANSISLEKYDKAINLLIDKVSEVQHESAKKALERYKQIKKGVNLGIQVNFDEDL